MMFSGQCEQTNQRVTAGHIEFSPSRARSEGDFNGDQRFGSGDLVTAFQDGGYEKGPRAAVSAVPEPAGIVLLLFGLFSTVRKWHVFAKDYRSNRSRSI
jgi:hypothetical protein